MFKFLFKTKSLRFAEAPVGVFDLFCRKNVSYLHFPINLQNFWVFQTKSLPIIFLLNIFICHFGESDRQNAQVEMWVQYGRSSHANFCFFFFVQMKEKLQNPAVWSFLYFVNEFPMGRIFSEILNLCEVRKFCDDPASRSANWDQVNKIFYQFQRNLWIW